MLEMTALIYDDEKWIRGCLRLRVTLKVCIENFRAKEKNVYLDCYDGYKRYS